MPSSVCTLFEKNHHYGVAALINSLYKYSYRGSIYVGYKGELPAWCSSGKADPEILWENASTLQIAEGCKVHFLPVKTEMHFAFYKPHFMIALFGIVKNDVEGIVYFDPDIVIKCRWIGFEAWISHGVAMVHEITDMPATHPMRWEWKKVINIMNKQPTRSLHSYFNSGFCGVTRQNIEFLTVWAEVINVGIQHFKLTPTRWVQTNDRTYLFFNPDQDAFNIAAMCCDSPISEIGPEGMDITLEGFVMSHALGRSKPWNKKFIRMALKGIAPSAADKNFWANTKSPIQLYGNLRFKIKILKLYIAIYISRFYKRH